MHYKNTFTGRVFPVTEQATEEVLSLPISPEMRDDKVELVTKVLLSVD
ncbi:MAG: DegT/DnrJ/EryC1/StrS family aminotransferase [Abditibacteriaceae bacterium]